MLAALQHSWVTSLYRNGNLPADGLRGSKDEACFAIYRASLLANLTQALAGTYPVIEKLVGEPFLGQRPRFASVNIPRAMVIFTHLASAFLILLNILSRLLRCRIWPMSRDWNGWRTGHFMRQTAMRWNLAGWQNCLRRS